LAEDETLTVIESTGRFWRLPPVFQDPEWQLLIFRLRRERRHGGRTTGLRPHLIAADADQP
jgi:hypothetical protein